MRIRHMKRTTSTEPLHDGTLVEHYHMLDTLMSVHSNIGDKAQRISAVISSPSADGCVAIALKVYASSLYRV